MKQEADLTLAEACIQLAVPWWELYEKDFQRFLRDPSPSMKPNSDYVKAAKGLIEKGLTFINKVPKDYIAENVMAFHTYANLRNHMLYHWSVQIICDNIDVSAGIPEIVEMAEECLNLSENKNSCPNLWYELQQTAAFALLMLGDQTSKGTGQKIMRDLLRRKTPGRKFEPPPEKWLKDIWDECFPSSPDGTQNDRFHLGSIPRVQPGGG